MKRISILILLLITLILTTVASAQTELVFETVQIQLWPEYDRPSMLVIYSLELPADQPLPVEFTISIPARAGEPIAVAVLEQNQLLTQAYSLVEVGEWSEITIVTDSPVVHLEYYDPSLSQADPRREFLLEWSFDYPINSLVVSAKQPANSQGFTLQPELGAGQLEQDGLLTYGRGLGSLPAGEVFSFRMSYTKSENSLAADEPVLPGEQLSAEPAAGDLGAIEPWIWALIGVGVVLIVGGGVYFFQVSRKSPARSTYRQKKARTTAIRSAGKTAGFCHQCGAVAGEEDAFCRMCGVKLRR